jgi:hypothetical protein
MKRLEVSKVSNLLSPAMYHIILLHSLTTSSKVLTKS